MNFDENITLKQYSNLATGQFENMAFRLKSIDSSFEQRMNGKTTGKLIGSFIGTIVWLVAYIVGILYAKESVNGTLVTIAICCIMGLILFMMIDTIMDFSYYGKIASYKKDIAQLQNRVGLGTSAIGSDYDAFMASKSKGWNYHLHAAASIPDEAMSIEKTVKNMESLKKGFVNSAKNVFFFAAVVAITVIGCLALFPLGSKLIYKIVSIEYSAKTQLIHNIIAMAIVGIGGIFLSWLVWSKTNCSVTNVTLLISLFAPAAFLPFIALVVFIVLLAILLGYILFAILVVAIFVGILWGLSCGD